MLEYPFVENVKHELEFGLVGESGMGRALLVA